MSINVHDLFLHGVARRTLVFAYMTGCEACAEAHPAVKAFKAAHPEIVLIEVDLAVEDWPEDELLGPDAVPSYADLAPYLLPRTVTGRGLTQQEIESWFFQR